MIKSIDNQPRNAASSSNEKTIKLQAAFTEAKETEPTTNGQPAGLTEVWRKTNMADFPATQERTGKDEVKTKQISDFSTESLDDLVVYKDKNGKFYYQVIFNPTPIGRMMAGQNPEAGAIVPLPQTKTENNGDEVQFAHLTDVSLPALVMSKDTYLDDKKPDELFIRGIKPADGGPAQLSVYGNVTDDGACAGNYEILRQMREQVGAVGSRLGGNLDMNADGLQNEFLDQGDIPATQVSILYRRRQDPL